MDENAGIGASVGTPVEALMPTGAEVTYSISGVTGRFDINSATGQITIAGDIAARAYPATVTATFTESQYPYTQVGAGSIAVTITVTSQGQWRQYAKLTAGDGADGDRLGESLALDPTTGTIVSGAPEVGNSAGAVYVFEGPDDTAPVKLTPPPGTPNELFGMSMVVDGDVIAVGTRCQCADAKVYVYKKPTAGWATTGTPTAALSAPTSDVDFDDGLWPQRASCGWSEKGWTAPGSTSLCGYPTVPVLQFKTQRNALVKEPWQPRLPIPFHQPAQPPRCRDRCQG